MVIVIRSSGGIDGSGTKEQRLAVSSYIKPEIDKLYIDFCGNKLSYTDKVTGELIEVEVFIAVLPCSQYTFVKAVPSQKREDLIGCLSACLQSVGCVPQAIVSDNLKSAVSKTHKYAPLVNKTLADFALFYGCAVEPARPYHP